MRSFTVARRAWENRRTLWRQANAPLRTSTQVTAGLHTVHRLVLKFVPLDRPVHHSPVAKARPVMYEDRS